MNQVRTRFAPSPSGHLHVGGARTALFNYLFAVARKGKFIIRIEDTDQERSNQESERLIIDSLQWLGIQADESPYIGGDYGPYRQSERLDIYKKYTQTLLKNGLAYRCFCTNEELEAKKKRSKEMGIPHVYDGQCRGLSGDEIENRLKNNGKYAIRFRAGIKEVLVDDIVQGRVKFDTKIIGDFIIVKSDGFPSYNYAVVIDDYEMQISHIIRGVGHLSNTPRQMLIHEALQLPLPAYAHISEIVGTDKKKLSKRRGATSVLFFRDHGFTSNAFVNYMALLGWYPEDAVEFMPDGELAQKFDLDRCSKSPAMFDFFLTKKGGEDFNPLEISEEELLKLVNKKSKLNWLNNKYIRYFPLEKVWAEAQPFIANNSTLAKKLKTDPEKMKISFDTLRVYINNYGEIVPFMVEIFNESPQLHDDARAIIAEDGSREVIQTFQNLMRKKKPAVPEEYKEAMKETGEKTGAKGKSLFMPIRAATTGLLQGLELPSLFSILGYKTVIDRIDLILGQA